MKITRCDFCVDGDCEFCHINLNELTGLQKEIVNTIYNQALDDVIKIYNEMRPKLATNVYEFGERIKALKK